MDIKNTTQVPSPSTGKVDSTKADKAVKARSSMAGEALSPSGRKIEGYNVAVSPEAQELKAARQKAFQIAKDTSPIRADRVAELKARIENGTYEIDSGNIADGMLREAIREKLATGE